MTNRTDSELQHAHQYISELIGKACNPATQDEAIAEVGEAGARIIRRDPTSIELIYRLAGALLDRSYLADEAEREMCLLW